jgi:hypothetical protein
MTFICESRNVELGRDWDDMKADIPSLEVLGSVWPMATTGRVTGMNPVVHIYIELPLVCYVVESRFSIADLHPSHLVSTQN